MKYVNSKILFLSLVFAIAISKTDAEYSRRRSAPSHINQKGKRNVLLKDEEERNDSFFDSVNGQENDIWTSEKEVWDRMLQDMSMSMMGGDTGFTVEVDVELEFNDAGGALVDLSIFVTNLEEEELEFEIEIEPGLFDCGGDTFGPVDQGETFSVFCLGEESIFLDTLFEITVTNVNTGEEVETEVFVEIE